MKTNTFAHLESLCAAKGIVCERHSSGRFTMTTPNGAVESEHTTVADALDTLRTDPTFSELPIQLHKAPAPGPELYRYEMVDMDKIIQTVEASNLTEALPLFRYPCKILSGAFQMAIVEDSKYPGVTFGIRWQPVTPQITLPSLTDEDAERIGAAIAKTLCLKPHPEHGDRYGTAWGSKTNKGLARTILSQFKNPLKQGTT